MVDVVVVDGVGDVEFGVDFFLGGVVGCLGEVVEGVLV